ncbi:beta-ketoacyl-ACP synthase II [bacterium]|nr:beta-ketoacyl-ACP synthase II [bacterium]
MEKRRVVITGMGAITPYGIGVDKLWDAVKNGVSGITYVEPPRIDAEKQTTHIYGVVPEYDEEQYMDAKEAKRLDDFIKYALVASEEAMKESKLNMDEEDEYRVGCLVSSAAGGHHTIEESHIAMLNRGYTKCSPFTVPAMIVNMAAGKVAIKYGLKGVNKAIVSACATSTQSIGDAFRNIQYGDADVIVTGGSEATVCNMGVGAFSAARTLSKRNDEPTKASRPYDVDRDGFIMSEGSGVLVVEELEHAKKRGATIIAEIVGYGQTCDAYDIVAPDPTGASAAKAMEFALKDAGITPEDVDYINTHGTSTHVGDLGEALAISKVFGEADKNNHLMVSSTKSMHGHLLGAAGAIEAIVCVKAIQDGIVPPTINLDNQDPELPNLNYVPHKAVKADLKYTMSNSFGFGGHDASIIIKKYEE